MKNMKLGLLFSTAAMAFAVGCGGLGGGSDGGTEGASCTSDDNCAVGFACNLGTNECQETCNASDVPNGCPASTPVCASVKNSTATFCRCNSDTTCNGNGSGTSTPYCNQDSGKCQATAWVPATCTPHTDNAVCAAADSTKPFCNYQTMTCSATEGTPPGPLACTGTLTNAQPDVCGYGSWCSDADQHCATITAGACANVSSFSSWSSTSTGAVIYKIEDISEAGLSPCSDPTAVRYDAWVYAYAGPDLNEWPAARANLPGGGYYNSSGTNPAGATWGGAGASLVVPNGYISWNDGTSGGISDHKVAKFHITLCGAPNSTTISAAFAFTNGNGACATLTHN